MSAEEQALIRAFVLSSKQERYLGFIANPKLRAKFTRSLYHFADLDEAWAVEIPRGEQTTAAIENQLVRRGAPKTCYVVSTNDRIDQKILPLSEALGIVVGSEDGTLLSCVRGRLGYYEGESPNNRVLLVRA